VQRMSGAMKKLGIDQLSTEQRLSLIEEIWESLDEDSVPLSDAHRTELENRIADHEANPHDVVSMDEVKRSVLPPRSSK
jgi:putative addiction module component (TIGR02574 family)